MKIKYFIFFIISLFVFNKANVFASSTTNLCVYKGVSIPSPLFQTASDFIRKNVELSMMNLGNEAGSVELRIGPAKDKKGFVMFTSFTDHQLSNISLKPIIAGSLDNFTSYTYTDNWRSEPTTSSVQVNYTAETASEFMSYGFCPERVVMKVQRINYKMIEAAAGTTIGSITGGAALSGVGAIVCPTISPFLGIDPVTSFAFCTSTGLIAGTAAGPAAGATIGIIDGNKRTKWEIKNIQFIHNPKISDYLSIPGLFDIITDSHVLVADLVKSNFNGTDRYNDFSNTTCFTKDDVTYYNNKFDDILAYSKNTSYITLYKNNQFEHIAKIVSKKYAKGGECYNSNPGLQKSYEALSEKAKKVLGVFGAANEQNEKYKNECQYILGDPDKSGSFAYYLDITFRFIKFLAPILLIVLSIVDYIKVIASSDADLVNKTNKKTIIRLIFALLLFMLPIIISTILSLLGLQGKCDFNNIAGL